MPLELVPSPGTLYCVGPWPNPFAWRRPRHMLASTPHHHDGLLWDAPGADFATLYCATEPVGSFVETLAYYRRADDFVTALGEATDEDEPDPEYDFEVGGGTVPPDYFDLVLGRATLDPNQRFIDIDDPRTHAQLTEELPDLLAEHGFRTFDHNVTINQDRRITRAIAGHLYAHATDTTVAIRGLRYESRLCRGLECWALWEQCNGYLVDRETDPLTPEIPEIKKAAELLKLRLPRSRVF